MLGDRIREERERLGLTQPGFADVAGAKKRTLIDWEKGVSSPTAVQLSALARIGIDVQYIVTGVRSASALSPDENELLALFRAAPLAVKAAAIGALQGGAQASPRTKHVTVTARGRDTQAAGRKIINKGGKS